MICERYNDDGNFDDDIVLWIRQWVLLTVVLVLLGHLFRHPRWLLTCEMIMRLFINTTVDDMRKLRYDDVERFFGQQTLLRVPKHSQHDADQNGYL